MKIKEADLIYNYIQQYAPQNEALQDFAPLDTLLQPWRDAKSKYLYKMFGDNLILEREIEYVYSEEEIAYQYNIYRNSAINDFYNNFYTTLRKHEELWDALLNCPPHFGTSPYGLLVDRLNLLRNRWDGPEMRIPLPDGKNFKVAPGTKINRILGRLAKAYHVDGWKEAQDAVANANTFKVTKGILCLSIHPMDYMTMSDNAEGWQSCMCWSQKVGEYRAGTTEMLNSPCVVVAYLKHPTNTYEGWNSKIWRELYIVTPEVITNIKAYPYENSWLSKYIVSWLRELAETALVGNYEPELKLHASDPERESPWFLKNNVSFCFNTHMMYNDCGRVDQYMAISKNFQNHPYYNINYSGPTECMCCGNTIDDVDFDSESSLLCEDCEMREYTYCDVCGERISASDEEIYGLDDETLCYSCYENLAIVPFDDQYNSYNRLNCHPLYLMLPNGELFFHDHTYVIDLDRTAQLFFGSDATRNDIPTFEEKRYIPFEKATEGFLFESGMSALTQSLWKQYMEETDKEKLKTIIASLLERYDGPESEGGINNVWRV